MVNLQDVEDDSFISDVFLNIFKILNAEAYEATDSGGNTISLVDRSHDGSGKYWMGAYPDSYLEERSDFPLGIIKTPNPSDVLRGFHFTEEYYTFNLEVYGVRSEHPALFISKAWDALKRYEYDLNEHGLYNLSMAQSTQGMTMRGELKVHDMSLPVTVRRVRSSKV